MNMKTKDLYYILIPALVAGGVGWLLSGNWKLGITLFLSIAAGNLVQILRK
jgi:membrane protein implicated in regulation of membrane protease activity